MTPKEKAEELIEKFYEAVKNKYPPTSGILLANQCALIAVDEVLAQLNHLPTEGYGLEYTSTIEYWQEVKREITA